MAEKRKKHKKVKVYECAHYEYECDDLGKYCWCHNRDIPDRECNVGRSFYCQKFCPGFKKGNLQGSWVISDWEKEEVEEYRTKLINEAKKREIEERAMLKYLKEKYGS